MYSICRLTIIFHNLFRTGSLNVGHKASIWKDWNDLKIYQAVLLPRVIVNLCFEMAWFTITVMGKSTFYIFKVLLFFSKKWFLVDTWNICSLRIQNCVYYGPGLAIHLYKWCLQRGLLKGKRFKLSLTYEETSENPAQYPCPDRAGFEPANIVQNASFSVQHYNYYIDWDHRAHQNDYRYHISYIN